MASFAQPTERPHISKEAVPHIIDFLRDEKPSVRHRAVQGLLTHSQTKEGPEILLTVRSATGNKRVVEELCRLVGDLHDIAPDVLSTLINLSGHAMGLDQMLASPSLVDQLMENLNNRQCNYKRLTLMLLSNLTRSYQGASMFMSSDTKRKDLEGYNLLRLVRWFLEAPATVVTTHAVANEEEETSLIPFLKKELDNVRKHDSWEYVAGILANVTRVAAGRTFVMDWTRGLLRPLVHELRSKSVVRRRGIARMLRNVCNEFDQHRRLLDKETDGGLDLIHVALLSLSNGDDDGIDDHERDYTHPQLYSDSQIRDDDIIVRQKICEMLVVLTRTHHARLLMRERRVYPIVREMHVSTTKMVNRLKRSRGEEVDESSDESTQFDEVIFKLVDHLAAEEKVVEEGMEDAIEEVEEEGDEEVDEHGVVIGRENVTKGSGREYEVGFSYDPSAKNTTNKDDSSSGGEDSDEEDTIFSKGMHGAVDSDDDEQETSESESEGGDGDRDRSEKKKKKAIFSMKTLTPEEREKKAYNEKEKGNVFYSQKKYQKAIACYREGRKYLPPPRLTSICWSNESAAQGGLNEWKRAQECAKECIATDPHYVKGYARHAKALEKQKKFSQAVTTLNNGIKNLSGKNLEKLHPIHVRNMKWPEWMIEGVALLEKNVAEIAEKEKDYHRKVLEKEEKDRQIKKQRKEEAKKRRMKEEMEKEQTRNVKNQAVTLTKELKASNEKSQSKILNQKSMQKMTEKEREDVQLIVKGRRDTESQHREVRAEREKLRNDLASIRLSMTALENVQKEEAQLKVEQNEKNKNVSDRKHFASVGKMFVVQKSEDLLAKMVVKEEKIQKRLNILVARDEQLVAKLTSIQQELTEIAEQVGTAK